MLWLHLVADIPPTQCEYECDSDGLDVHLCLSISLAPSLSLPHTHLGPPIKRPLIKESTELSVFCLNDDEWTMKVALCNLTNNTNTNLSITVSEN